MAVDADKGFRYSAQQNAWLTTKVNEAVEAGVTSLAEVSKLLHSDWTKFTGRTPTFDAFCNKVRKCDYFKKRRSGAEDGGTRVRRQFAEGSMICVVSKAGVASMHKDLDAALTVVDGAVADYTFYECKPFRVSYKTVLVVE